MSSITQFYFSGAKFVQYEDDGSALIISTNDTVYVVNPWDFIIYKQYKITGKIHGMVVADGIVFL